MVGNLLEWLLRKYKKATLGMLLGLLLGSTVGLWPFQEGVQPVPGDIIKGAVVTFENRDEIEPDDWNVTWVQPRFGQIAISLLLISGGVVATVGVAKVGAYLDSSSGHSQNEASGQ